MNGPTCGEPIRMFYAEHYPELEGRCSREPEHDGKHFAWVSPGAGLSIEWLGHVEGVVKATGWRPRGGGSEAVGVEIVPG